MTYAATMIDEAFRAAPQILAIVKDNFGLKGQLPDDGPDAPAIEWQRISTVDATADLDGAGGLHDVRMQVTYWGETADQAIDLAAMGLDILAPEGATGIGRLDGEDGPDFDTEARVWGVRQDYFIWQERT